MPFWTKIVAEKEAHTFVMFFLGGDCQIQKYYVLLESVRFLTVRRSYCSSLDRKISYAKATSLVEGHNVFKLWKYSYT